MIKEVTDYLNELFPNPKCELNYNKDYELLIAVMLSAQTTDKKVNMVTKELFNKYPTIETLKNADTKDIMQIIRPIGTYNKKAIYIKEIARLLYDNYNCMVPNTFEELENFPGVGHKSASVVLGNIYDVPTFAVDTHVTRVTKRLGFVNNDDDVVVIEEKMKQLLKKELWCRTHHQLVLFGRYLCTAKNPKCINCKLKNRCNYNK